MTTITIVIKLNQKDDEKRLKTTKGQKIKERETEIVTAADAIQNDSNNKIDNNNKKPK